MRNLSFESVWLGFFGEAVHRPFYVALDCTLWLSVLKGRIYSRFMNRGSSRIQNQDVKPFVIGYAAVWNQKGCIVHERDTSSMPEGMPSRKKSARLSPVYDQQARTSFAWGSDHLESKLK